MANVLRLTAVVAAMLILTPASASAHPLGNFTVNRFSGLEVSQQEILVHYAVDVAEVPTFQEFASIDVDQNNSASPSELTTYADAKALFLLGGVRLMIDGVTTSLSIRDAAALLMRGQGGLQTLRLDVTMSAALPRKMAVIEYRDRNFGSLPGWKEIVATGVLGETVVSSDVPSLSVSDRLRAYPRDLLAHPPARTSARFAVAPGGSAVGLGEPTPSDAQTVPSTRLFGREFAALIERDLTLPSIAIAMMLAMAFGAVHALAPGHGKTVTAAYLVGSGAKLRHAVGVGFAVSLMHTASVIALGSVTLYLTDTFSPAVAYPWLSFASGIVIVGVGAWMVTVRSRARARARAPEHGDGHAHDDVASPLSRKGLAAIAVSGGLVPSPTAVVVLLAAVSLHRVAFGLALIVAFSLGLAAALSAAGVLVLRARTFTARRWGIGPGSILPVLSGAAVALVGCLLTVRALMSLS